MDGHNPHGFIPEDLGYDDLINNTGWPPAGEQQHHQYYQPQPQVPPQPPTQDIYARYQHGQPTFGQYDLSQQPSYPQVPSYSNSPYVSQYQHARPSDVFGPPSYNVDPSLSSPAGYHGQDNSFAFAPHAIENPTISPQSLQYSMQTTQPMPHTINSAAFPHAVNGISAFNQRPQEQSSIYFPVRDPQSSGMHLTQSNPIRYPALGNGTSENESKQAVQRTIEGDTTARTQPIQPVQQPVQQSLQQPVQQPVQQPTQQPVHAIQPAQQAQAAPHQIPLRMVNSHLLEQGRPYFEYAPFLVLENEPVQVPPGTKTTVPKYHPRKSRSGKELIPGFNVSSSLTPARPSTKKARPPKEPKPSTSKIKVATPSIKPLSVKVASLREDEHVAAAKSPSASTDASSSEEESSSDEESEYEEDERIPVMDISEVRGSTRPTDVSAAAKWDAIGIIWKDPNSIPNADVVKEAIEKYGNFVSALRLRLKTNSTKIEEAASRPAEATKLKDERKVLLESLYQTIDAANSLGYPAIVENLGGHHKLVNGLTTTLIECIKTDDFLGKLPKAVFQLLSKFQTMTDELLKKLKFDSIQKRWNKKGDEETKKYISTILSNTTDAKEKAAKTKKDVTRADEEKKVRDRAEPAKARTTEAVGATAMNPAKRPHESDGTNGNPNKKFAANVSGTPGSSKILPAKRTASNLLGIASKPAPKPAAKKREPSPPTESKLGALLASIAKPPEPPKAPEAPTRPPETPEEKARRERKESRRHLRVKFKDGPELEEIRLFKHELAEDEGRQDGMLRDAHDDRQEGMMHKKRVSETIDDDEEYQPPDFDQPYTQPIKIDFSLLEKSLRFGPGYTTRGGDLGVVTSEQKVQERREALELMVIYTDPNDIPPSPKELSHFDETRNAEPAHQLKYPTEPWMLQRLQQIHQYGPETASQLFQSFGVKKSSAAKANSNDIPTLLQQLSGSVQPSTIQNHTPAMHPEDLAALLRTIQPLIGKPYPPTEPPEWMNQPGLEASRAEWIAGFERDKRAAGQAAEGAARISQAQAAHLQAPAMLPPQFQQQIAPSSTSFPTQIPLSSTAPTPQISDITQQVQSYLAGYQNPENNAAPVQQFDYNSWAANNPSGQTQSYPVYDQQQRWEGTWNNDNSNQKPNKVQDTQTPKTKQRGFDLTKDPSLFDERGEYKGKKKPCKFYQEGKCAKGAKCTYLHDF